MNKKFVQAFAGVAFFALVIGLAPSAFATYSSGNGYNTPTYKSELNFQAAYSNGQVAASWSAYEPAGFNYYKEIRSTTNPNPVYPENLVLPYLNLKPPVAIG